MKMRLLLILGLVLSVFGVVSAQDAVELRLTWYDDGSEGAVMRELLDGFEAENPGITVVMDTIPYADLHTTLQAQVEAGSAPDLARVNDVARFHGQYLDLTEYVADPAYYTSNFTDAVLDSLREDLESEAIYGFPLQFTVTIPYVNSTLFEQAGVELPSAALEEPTWEDWVAAAAEVAEATETPYAVAIDPRGHRFWGFSLVEGAEYFDEEGNFQIDSPGFRTAAETLLSWQSDGLMPPESWLTGDLEIAKQAFINGQVVLYYSGPWQLTSFRDSIGDTFDWQVIPNPYGPGGSTGVPGGSLLVAFEQTEHPEEVGLLMDYLTQPDKLEEFSVRTLFPTGHLGLIEQGVEYTEFSDALNVILSEIPKLSPQAYALQYSPYAFTYNRPIDQRLAQVIAGELTLDEAIELIQSDVDDAIAAANGS